MNDWQVITGDCLEVMRGMDAGSVDAVITDPPAGISFMGKEWDHHKGGRAQWVEWMTAVMEECRRVLKPGGHALVWALPRTSHWTATAVEDAGFEIRDKVYHLFGSGFPKSLDIGKAIDRAAGMEREFIGTWSGTYPDNPQSGGPQTAKTSIFGSNGDRLSTRTITAPATDAARQWDGWGTALKPAVEEWILARKPIQGNVAANVLEWGTGGLNIAGCRVAANGDVIRSSHNVTIGGNGIYQGGKPADTGAMDGRRYPANLIHDGSPEVLAGFPVTGPSGWRKEHTGTTEFGQSSGYNKHNNRESDIPVYLDTGSAARFFYCAKASKADRDEGLDGLSDRHIGHYAQDEWSRQNMGNTPDAERKPVKNHHPTVKSTSLMRYLCRLITPPGGVILDPFTGSGSTGKAAILEGFSFIGIEQDAEYAEIARARITKAAEQARQLELL